MGVKREYMEEINLKELFDYFVSKWFIIAIAGLVFVLEKGGFLNKDF